MKPYLGFATLIMCCATSWADEIPAWTKEDVVTTIGTGAKAAGSTYDAAKGSLPADAFQARNLTVLGNRAARVQLASQANQLVKSCNDLSKVNQLPLISSAIQIADVGSTVAGRLYEKDLAGAGAELVNEGAKTAVTTAGTLGGAKAGALIGTMFSPVGTVVGGAIGAVVGSFATSAGYDAVVGGSLKGAVDSGFEKSKEDYLNDARKSRHQFLANKEREKAESAERIRQTGEALAEGLIAADADQQARTQSIPTAISAPPDEAVQPADATIPVIPVDCTISVVVWSPEYDRLKIPTTYKILDGNVSGSYSLPTDSGASNGLAAGTIKDNVMTLKTRFRTTGRGSLGNFCTYSYITTGEVDSTLELNRDQSVTIIQPETSTNHYQHTVLSGKWPENSPLQGTSTNPNAKLVGKWEFVRKSESK